MTSNRPISHQIPISVQQIPSNTPFSYNMSLYMLVEKCPSRQTACFKCSRSIGLGSLRVKKSSYGSNAKYYHLSCYKPEDPRPIDFQKHVNLKGITAEKEVERVKKWVETWNSRFVAKEEMLPVLFKAKGVETVGSPLRRLLLETFLYLELREIERIVAFVSKEWFHITRDNEFWKTRYVAAFQPSETSEKDTYRTKFITKQQGCCWICHHFVPLKDIKMLCPLRKRPLCYECARKGEGRIVTLNAYFQQTQVSSSLVARLRFKHFIYCKFKHNYVSNLANTIIPYAEKRRKDLLDLLKTRFSSEITADIMSDIENFDIVEYYKGGGKYGILPLSLGKFCGKNDEFEELETSVTQFLANFR